MSVILNVGSVIGGILSLECECDLSGSGRVDNWRCGGQLVWYNVGSGWWVSGRGWLVSVGVLR